MSDQALKQRIGGRIKQMVTLKEQMECVQREIKMRESVYQRWVQAGKMKQESADKELVRMRAVLETLREVWLTKPERRDAQQELPL